MNLKKTLITVYLASQLTLGNATGVPTADGVQIGLGVKGLVESLTQTFNLVKQYKLQVDEYKNQFGEMKGLVDDIDNLEFIKLADSYIPKDWNKTIDALYGLSKHAPAKIREKTQGILNEFKNINIGNEITRKEVEERGKRAVAEYELYLTQIKTAQDRVRATEDMSERLKSVTTQKEREALLAKINIENLKASAEVTQAVASKNAKEAQKRVLVEMQKKHSIENFEAFIGGNNSE